MNKLDDDAPNYELDNNKEELKDVSVIYRSRRNFYNGKPIYWYEFLTTNGGIDYVSYIPPAFLNVFSTVYYEFGGTHEEAILSLTKFGFTNIVEGEQI